MLLIVRKILALKKAQEEASGEGVFSPRVNLKQFLLIKYILRLFTFMSIWKNKKF